jgi:hypothetical protein
MKAMGINATVMMVSGLRWTCFIVRPNSTVDSRTAFIA